MKNVNQRRNYSNFKFFNDCCAVALHDAQDVFKEYLGTTLRTGGEWEFIRYNPQEKIDRHTTHMLKYASRKAIGSNGQTDSKRQPGQPC